MMYYKSCPRCDGDRTLEHDFDGYHLLCLQCGNVQYPSVEQKRTTKRSIFTQTPAERAMVPSVEAIVGRLRKSVAFQTA